MPLEAIFDIGGTSGGAAEGAADRICQFFLLTVDIYNLILYQKIELLKIYLLTLDIPEIVEKIKKRSLEAHKKFIGSTQKIIGSFRYLRW